MNYNNKAVIALFILGATILIIASFLKISNIEIADYILAIGMLLMVLNLMILFIKYRKTE